MSSLHRAVFESVYVSVLCVCVNKFLLPFFVACWMPVTHPLLSCSPFLSFQSALRASGQSCAQCPWFLHSLHFVQPEKSCSPLAHSPHLCAARAALICTTASCISLPLFAFAALLVLVHSASRAAVVLDGETVEVGANFNAPSWAIG